MHNRFRLFLSLLFVSGVQSPVVNAAEWKLDPNISLRAGYNDNIRISTDDELSSTEVTLLPTATFSYQTPTSGISGALAFQFRRFLQEDNLDDNNVRLDLDTFRRGERSQSVLNIDIIKDTTLDSELEETGIVVGRVNRFRGNLNPSWSYSFNPRTTLDLSYTYSLVDYDEADTAFVDFTSHSGQLSLSRMLTERSSATLTAGHTFTDTENDVQSNYSYIQGGASYRFSETLSASLFGGVSHSETEFTAQTPLPIFAGGTLIGFTVLTEDAETSNDGIVFSGSITKDYLRGQTTLSATRNVSTSISGILVQDTRISLTQVYRFSEILYSELDFSVSNSESTNEIDENLGGDYYQIEPRVIWNFKQFWRISGSYRYRKQTYDNSDDEATQNAAYLTLTYDWPRIAASR